MIILKLKEGLGNQMFQYAIARSLSIRKKNNFKLDISSYELFQLEVRRKYALNCFNIIANFATKEDINKVLAHRTSLGLLQKVIYQKVTPYFKKKVVEEQKLIFDKNIFKVKKNIILDGYWANEKYFKSIEKIIRHEFSLKPELIHPMFEGLSSEITTRNSISIHIRRSDYLHIKTEASDLFSICEIDYYNRAIKYICQKIKNPFFYIFSDDVEWVKESFKISFPNKLVSGTQYKDYEELILMSYCKHNIIANSTFSWWAAWLNSNPDKLVIAPKKWYNNPIYQNFYETSDFVPLNWIRI